jgi:parvulin-like peptidyl-prolyl isomerase
VKRLLREPLLHFLVLGAAIFAVYQWISGEGVSTREPIVVSAGRIEAIAANFNRTWQRSPSRQELEALVRDYVREEVASREAVAMGLDRDDVVIRRRLRQKLEFISESAQKEPTDAELQAYLDAHRDKFQDEARWSFEQIYLDPQRHSGDQVAALLKRVRAGAAADGTPGDPIMLERRFDDVEAAEVSRQFGPDFAAKLGSLPLGEWVGPATSGYGLHLVRVSARIEAQVRPLAEARDEVRREWSVGERQAQQDRFYQSLLSKYAITIERPGSASELAGAQ